MVFIVNFANCTRLSTNTLLGVMVLVIPLYSQAASFTITDGQVVTTQQILIDNETGVIDEGGQLNTTNAAIVSSGDNINLTNSGTIFTTGDFANGISSSGNNGTLTNRGTISTIGDRSNAILTNFGSDITVTNTGFISTVNDEAVGIRSGSFKTNVTNTGTISTSGIEGTGILSFGTGANILNTGTISTAGVAGEGISSFAANANLTNVGEIITTGEFARGIFSLGESTTIVNTGTISTEENISDGVKSSGSNADITNRGIISTIGNGSDGINSTGNSDLIVTNTGTILTAGNSTDGIFSNVTDAIVTNSGTISTTGNLFAHGIRFDSFGGSPTVVNIGDISTTGQVSTGISIRTASHFEFITSSDSGQTTLSNRGTISTVGENAYGIRLILDGDAGLTNSGVISTTGFNADGISLKGMDVILNNSGTISTNGDAADGISISDLNTIINTGILLSTDAVLTNSGTIQIAGNNANGIHLSATNSSITNTGAIEVTGTDSSAILILGTTNIDNDGLISATKGATTAIKSSTNDDTLNLNLLSKSQIIGSIDLGTGNDVINISTSATTSSTIRIVNAEKINLRGISAGINVNDSVIIVDPTGQSVNGSAFATATDGIHRTITQRIAYDKSSKHTQVASFRLKSGSLVDTQGPQSWGNIFGIHRTRDQDGQVLAYDQDYYGFTGGYETSYDHARIGAIAGFAVSKIKTDVTSIKRDTDSFFTGGYGQFRLGKVNFTAALIGGYEWHDNDRIVLDSLRGFEVAKADLGSFFLSPSFTLSEAYNLGSNFTFRPSITLVYGVAWYDEYSETGTTRSNLHIGDRTLHALTGRLQLAVTYKLNESSEFELRVGGKIRLTEEDEIRADLSGVDLRYSSAADKSVYGGYLGAYAKIPIKDRMLLVANTEFSKASGDETQISAMLGIDIAF